MKRTEELGFNIYCETKSTVQHLDFENFNILLVFRYDTNYN
jgi:hypothetical protein